MRGPIFILTLLLAASGTVLAAPPPMVYEGTPGGLRQLEEGQPPAMVHATVEAMQAAHSHANASHPNNASPFNTATSSLLSYHNGYVEPTPTVYLVLWGSQWNNNDPSGEVAILQNFFQNVSYSSWLGSVTQYYQTVSGIQYASNIFNVVVWSDNGSAAPSHPKQSQFAAEAVRAANHFGNTSSTNVSVQYVIATAHGYNSPGFGSQYCAYHSSTTSSSAGTIAYTNLPYITDAGASCGANFNGLGPTAGITIVAGHELAETMTDQFPSGGWLDSNGQENGDKCAWSSSTALVPMPTTTNTQGYWPVQPLWSNAANSNQGGCVLSYP